MVGEIFGILGLAAAFLLLLALLSWEPADTTGGSANWVGPAGAFVADTLLFTFGLGAFLCAAIALWTAVSHLRGRPVFRRYGEAGGHLLLLFGVTAGLEVVARGHMVLGHRVGGLIGQLAGGVLVQFFGFVGGVVLSLTIVAVALVLVLEQRMSLLGRDAFSSGVTLLSRVRVGDWLRRRRAAARAAAAAAAVDSAPSAEPVETSSPSRRIALDDPDTTTDTGDAVARPGVWARLRERIRRRRDVTEEIDAGIETPAASTDTFSFGRVERDDSDAWSADFGGPSSAERRSASNPEDAPPSAPAPSSRATRSPASPATPPPAPPAPDFVAPVASDTVAPVACARRGRSTLQLEDGDAAANEPAAGDTPAPRGSSAATAPPAPPAAFGPVVVDYDAVRNRKRPDELRRADQLRLALGDSPAWELPPLDFLAYRVAEHRVDEARLREQAQALTIALGDYGVRGTVTNICPGPVVTCFEFEPEKGTKLSKIEGLSKDLAMALRVTSARIAPNPNKGVVGVEVPNDHRETVYLKELIADEKFVRSRSRLTMALGKDTRGNPVTADLARMPHVLVAGTTGSGKSVLVNCMIASILYNSSPDDVRLIMIDPKQLEFALYRDVPHLLLPVVTEPEKAAVALNWAVNEMERRYGLMADLMVRNIEGYNDKLRDLVKGTNPEDVARWAEQLDRVDPDGRPSHRHLPFIVVIVDEFADLIMAAGKEVEQAVARLAQKARAAGIHVILATQRPSTDVITGLIKANFPTRISCRLLSHIDSRTVLDMNGAETLLGQGDMLFRPAGSSELKRVHGGYVDEVELEKIVEFLKKQRQVEYDENILRATAAGGSAGAAEEDEPVDDLYDQAVAEVIEQGFASISNLQRKLGVGYNRAAKMVEYMEREGIVGPAKGGAGRRDVLVGPGGVG